MHVTSAHITFAQTKIQPPRPRSELITRVTVERKLHLALTTCRLTLLQAPAGWGKTSALTRALAQLPADHVFVWIAADEDDDLQRFIACLSVALEPLDLAWRVAPQALPTLALAERGLRLVADEVANALASSEVERGLIVVDDAHRVKDARVFELLRMLLESMPAPHWGVVLSTRTVPDLPLARWRARGELAELRLEDLRFDEAEVATLLSSSGVEPQIAAELTRRTGGWAAGLRLFLTVGSGAAGGGRALASSQRHVFEYLADEVLATIDAELREFLLRCSILPELTPRRCAHVAGQPRAGRMLEQLEREGLFVIRLDAEERTLRLHDLFRDFLEDRLQRDHAAELPVLLRRAAEHEPDLARAVGWLMRAGAWDEAAGAMAERGPKLVQLGAGPTVERLLTQFPDEERQRSALHYLRALCAYQQFDFEVVFQEMEQGAAGYERSGQHQQASMARVYAAVGMRNSGRQELARKAFSRLDAGSLTGSAAALAAYFSAWEAYADHRPEQVAPAFARTLEWLEQTDDAQLWAMCFMHGFLIGCPGMAPLARRFDEGAMRLTSDVPSVLRASVFHSRATFAWGHGDLVQAVELLALADEDVRWMGSPRALVTENYMLHLALDGLRGDVPAVEEYLQRMRGDMRESAEANRRTHINSALLAGARACWLIGDDAGVREIEQDMAQARNSFEWRPAEVEHLMARGMVALAQERDHEAVALLGAALLDIADEDVTFFRNTQTRIMLAEAHCRLHNLDAAAATLRPWLQSAHGGGFVGGAMMAGLRVLEPLARCNWGGRLTLADLTLLQRLCDAMGGLRSQRRSVASRSGGLTEREWQVLERIAAGDSNKAIARTLDLSLFTVKRHVANIFDKLALSSRTQAAVWLRAQRNAGDIVR